MGLGGGGEGVGGGGEGGGRGLGGRGRLGEGGSNFRIIRTLEFKLSEPSTT